MVEPHQNAPETNTPNAMPGMVLILKLQSNGKNMPCGINYKLITCW
jgi:hypothetical protein